MKIKKLKKVIAGVLSAAMVMSTMAVTAFAAGSTIDQSRKGSITLYKYQYLNTGIPGNLQEGTGETETVPAGATPLKDVEFSMWKIADIEGKVTVVGHTNDTFVPAGNMAQDTAAAEKLLSNGSGGLIPADATDTTDSNGLAEFGKSSGVSSLDLGYYYVKETATPDSVTSQPVAFVVSVPTTNRTDSATTSDTDETGTYWVYDVVVYPKNATASAGMTINKVDANDASSISSAKFVLQRQENGVWKYINRDGNNITYGNDNWTEDDTFGGHDTISNLTEGSYRLIEVEVGDGYIMDGTETYDFSVSANGQIDSIEDEFSYNAGHESTQTAGTMTIANERPDLDKDIQKGDGTWSSENNADYSVGDDVPYRIKVSVPENIEKLSTFKITDVPTNLRFNNDLAIYTDENCQTSAGLTKDTDYTVTTQATDNEDGFTVDFVVSGSMTDAFKAFAGDDLYLYYTAELLNSADTSTTGNPNDVTLDYTSTIYPESDETDMPNSGNEEKEAHIEDHAIVYTFQIKVKKTNKDNQPLKDAEFALYRCTSSELTDEEEVKKGTPIGNYTTDESGLITVKGLENGYYYLIETKAPDDYNLLNAPVEVELQIQYVTTYSQSSSWVKGADGEWVLTKHEVSSTTFTPSKADTDSNVEDGIYDVKIINKKGFELPVTGGTGTLLASLIGILLMGGGAFVFISSRKKKKAE